MIPEMLGRVRQHHLTGMAYQTRDFVGAGLDLMACLLMLAFGRAFAFPRFPIPRRCVVVAHVSPMPPGNSHIFTAMSVPIITPTATAQTSLSEYLSWRRRIVEGWYSHHFG